VRVTFSSEGLTGGDHSEDLGEVGEINVGMDLGEVGWDGVNWIHLPLDGDQWRALVDTVVSLRVP